MTETSDGMMVSHKPHELHVIGMHFSFKLPSLTVYPRNPLEFTLTYTSLISGLLQCLEGTSETLVHLLRFMFISNSLSKSPSAAMVCRGLGRLQASHSLCLFWMSRRSNKENCVSMQIPEASCRNPHLPQDIGPAGQLHSWSACRVTEAAQWWTWSVGIPSWAMWA